MIGYFLQRIDAGLHPPKIKCVDLQDIHIEMIEAALKAAIQILLEKQDYATLQLAKDTFIKIRDLRNVKDS